MSDLDRARPELERRMCACGCPRSFLVKPTRIRIYFRESCRVRAHEAKRKAAAKAAGLPGSRLSLSQIETVSQATSATRRKPYAEKARRPPRRPRPSDVRVPLPRLLAALTDELGQDRARKVALAALTDRQRQEVERHGALA